MIWPPSILRLRMARPGRRRVNLWLPLILLWPLAVILWVPIGLLIVLIVALRTPRGIVPAALAGPRLFMVFCRLRGLRIRVGGRDDGVVVCFI